MNLFGRLEAVHIEGRRSDKCAYGKLINKNESVLVNNANGYSGEVCLARLDLFDRLYPEYSLRGNFISSKVPADFKGLAPEEYILCAIWDEYMENSCKYPSLDEINRYFNPGDMPVAVYLNGYCDEDHGRKIITPYGYTSLMGNCMDFILNNLSPQRVSRLILVESQSQVEELDKIINERGLALIEMEPLGQSRGLRRLLKDALL